MTKTMMNRTQVLKKKTKSKGLGKMVGDYQTEIAKVRWGSKKEVWSKAKLVIIATIIMGFLTYGADLVIRSAIDLCHLLFKWVFVR